MVMSRERAIESDVGLVDKRLRLWLVACPSLRPDWGWDGADWRVGFAYLLGLLW